MHIDDFTFALPDTHIARRPSNQRGDSRLLVARRDTNALVDTQCQDLLTHLRPNDLLIFNDTRVMPARCFGKKTTGGKIELLIEKPIHSTKAACLVRGSKKLALGQTLLFDDGICATVEDKVDGHVVLAFNHTLDHVMHTIGALPIPPYFDRPADARDNERYQTVFAKYPGAVAAPTAGLHFSSKHLQTLQQHQIQISHVTLHVGAGTFQPVQAAKITDHIMHAEQYTLPQACVDAITQCRRDGGRVIAVGTTVVRTLETVFEKYGALKADHGESRLFIRPGYQFQCIDGLITNFHLPKSTLLMMISAWMGHAFMHQAYQHAIRQNYRFYSYGDAMLIL